MTRADQRKYHIIYKTTCQITGKWYIGMHSTDDLNDGYKGSGQLLWKSMKKHGRDAHHCEILEHLPDRKSLSLREEEIITKELRADPLCMNLRSGGTGNYPGTPTKEETKAKLSAASKATPRTEEWCAKISAAHKGKSMSREAVEKQRAKVTGRKQSEQEIQARIQGQLASEKFKKRYRPFSVDGVVYQNGREAVQALGIPGGTLTNRLLSPNWLSYQYLDAPKDPSIVSHRARGAYSKSSV